MAAVGTIPMRRIALLSLLCPFLLATTVRGAEADDQSLRVNEKGGIDKIAQLSAEEHSTILFSVADKLIGVAKDGQVEWIASGHDPYHPNCGWPHPTLSHNGLRVALVSDGDTKAQCRIVIYDLNTQSRRDILQTHSDPGEIAWSWDDSEIAFFEKGISCVLVQDGSTKVLAPYAAMNRPEGYDLGWGTWTALQWLHDGAGFIRDAEKEIPTKQPLSFRSESDLLIVVGRFVHGVDVGSSPAVSPVSNQIAYYGHEGIVMINADGTGRTVLARRSGLSGEFPNRGIVWSKDGSWLFCGSMESEDRRDGVFLVDLKSGSSRRFLSRTSITIRGWH
jgi:hypothetical protein